MFDLSAGDGAAPLLSIFGGKITTYRKLAEHALENLSPYLAFTRGAWTKAAALPGGDMPNADFDLYESSTRDRYPWLPAALLRRFLRAYGSRIDRVLAGANRLEDLGAHFGAGLYQAEIRYLIEHEWACTVDDILWRRSKRGLHMSERERATVSSWMDETSQFATPRAGDTVRSVI